AGSPPHPNPLPRWGFRGGQFLGAEGENEQPAWERPRDTESGELTARSGPMPATPGLFQQVLGQINTITHQAGVRITSVRRLALLVTGLLTAQQAVLARMAAELLSLKLTDASERGYLERRLRRALSDPRLDPRTCYQPVVPVVIDWAQFRASGCPVR